MTLRWMGICKIIYLQLSFIQPENCWNFDRELKLQITQRAAAIFLCRFVCARRTKYIRDKTRNVFLLLSQSWWECIELWCFALTAKSHWQNFTAWIHHGQPIHLIPYENNNYNISYMNFYFIAVRKRGRTKKWTTVVHHQKQQHRTGERGI